MQNAEQNLNYVLLLKNLLDVIPELGKILLSGESDFFCKIQKVRSNIPLNFLHIHVYEYYTDSFINFYHLLYFFFRNWKLTNSD